MSQAKLTIQTTWVFCCCFYLKQKNSDILRERQTDRQRDRDTEAEKETETDREKSGLCERSDERNSDIYKKTILSVPTTAVSELLSAHIGER